MTKRLFDIFFAVTGLFFAGWLILLLYLLSSADTGQNGMFLQERVGRYGKLFTIYKIRSMRFTAAGQKKVSRFGCFMRRYKLDELPQFFNILKGDMSVVGPRPDIAGYYDVLTGVNRQVLLLRPGLTGPANLKYWDEEYWLARHPDPEKYNNEIMFPDKVKINLCYLKKQSFWLDIKIIAFTILKKKFPDDYFNC